MILVRVAEDQVIDPREVGTRRTDVGYNAVLIAIVEIVLASRIIKQREAGAFDEHCEAGADIDDMNLVTALRERFGAFFGTDDRPRLTDIAAGTIGKLDDVPAADLAHERRAVAGP
ncbi:hypothetical protein GGC65_002362 [Sphingopyxis sp. OAS728]|nr:hypothetical protein [Sphingopyxis sp. OAS728]